MLELFQKIFYLIFGHPIERLKKYRDECESISRELDEFMERIVNGEDFFFYSEDPLRDSKASKRSREILQDHREFVLKFFEDGKHTKRKTVPTPQELLVKALLGDINVLKSEIKSVDEEILLLEATS